MEQRPIGPSTGVIVAGLIIGLVVIGYGVHWGWSNRRRPVPVDPKVEAAKREEEKQAEEAYREALDKILAAPIAFSQTPCAMAKPMSPLKLDSMSLAWSGDRLYGKSGDQTHGYLMKYSRFTGSPAIVVTPTSGAPFENVVFGRTDVTLIVDSWTDPIVPEHVGDKAQFVVGEMRGRILLWDRAAKRFACGANVTAKNTNVTIVTTTNERDYSSTPEDPLSKVRVDLVNEAIRAGLDGPMTTID
jgi:hypothetical protein